MSRLGGATAVGPLVASMASEVYLLLRHMLFCFENYSASNDPPIDTTKLCGPSMLNPEML